MPECPRCGGWFSGDEDDPGVCGRCEFELEQEESDEPDDPWFDWWYDWDVQFLEHTYSL